MAVRFALILDDSNARRTRGAKNVDLVLLERTLIDPPRAAACRRWAEQLRGTFPKAQFVPYAWHLVSHGPDDGLRDRGSRTLPGNPAEFGRLQSTQANAEAMAIVDAYAETLQTQTIAIRTPPGLAPGAIGRKRIGEFVAARIAAGFRVVWEPEGLWTPVEVMAALAPYRGADGLLSAFEGGRPRRCEGDDDSVLAARGAWLRVEGAGTRRTIHGGHTDALAEHIEACGGATLVFSGPRAAANLSMAVSALDAEGLLD